MYRLRMLGVFDKCDPILETNQVFTNSISSNNDFKYWSLIILCLIVAKPDLQYNYSSILASVLSLSLVAS